MTSSSQEILLASSADGPITAYDSSMGTMLTHFSGSHCPRRGLALAGNTMIVASHISSTSAPISASICIYNWWSSAAFYHLPVPEPVAPLASTADGLFLFAGGISGQIHALSLPSGNLLCSLSVHRKPITCLTINDDGSLLISGGDDGFITVFPILQLLDAALQDPNSNHPPLHQLNAHALSITDIVFGTGGYNASVVSSSLDCTCKFWSLAKGTHLRTIQFPCPIWSVTMDPAEWVLFAGGSNGQVHVGDLKVSRRRQSYNNDTDVVALSQEHCTAVTALVMVNEGHNLVSASEDGVIRVWEVESGKVVRVLGQERTSVSDLLVAKGVGGGGRVHNGVELSNHGPGFSGKEISRPVREIGDMEWLDVVMEDRKRAIDMLEGAISTYQKLLTLFLKEAKGGRKRER